MAQQYLERLAGVNASQRLQYPFDVVDVGAEGHFEGEAVSETDALADRPEQRRLLQRHHPLRRQPQVPELYEQRLQRLDLEDLS